MWQWVSEWIWLIQFVLQLKRRIRVCCCCLLLCAVRYFNTTMLQLPLSVKLNYSLIIRRPVGMHKTSRSAAAALFLPDNITTKPRHRRPSHSPEKSPHRAPLIFTGSQKVQFLALSLNEFQLWATVVLKRGEISAPFLPCCIECRAVPYERLFSLVFWE